ncbi:MAG TPA: gephyrin-like molybdotransferase Glp [Thermoanaerobaculia bacterium]
MLTVEEAQARVMDEVSPGATESIALDDAHGRVLREDVRADDDAPAADVSAMDGYAVRAADVAQAPVVLPVIGDIPAGHPSAISLQPGAAMRIMTGASLPEGADTVVQVELTDGGRERVTIARAVSPGTNVRKRGDDMRAGEVVLRAGVRIGPAELALLAAVRKTRLAAGVRPTVAILSTGDELIAADAPPVPGKIVNSNAPMLAALVRECGAIPRDFGIVADTREATIAALEEAAQCDFIVTSGGVSVGAFDFVKEALDALGAETKFWRVAMKPGKPLVLARLRGRLFFGLPGNPASSFVAFHLFVGPALRKSIGEEVRTSIVPARCTSALKATPDRRTYARVRVIVRDGELVAEPLVRQGSGALTSMSGANGLAIVDESVAAGDVVRVLLL